MGWTGRYNNIYRIGFKIFFRKEIDGLTQNFRASGIKKLPRTKIESLDFHDWFYLHRIVRP